MSDVSGMTHDEKRDYYLMMYGTVFELRNEDGTVELLDPTKVTIHTRTGGGCTYGVPIGPTVTQFNSAAPLEIPTVGIFTRMEALRKVAPIGEQLRQEWREVEDALDRLQEGGSTHIHGVGVGAYGSLIGRLYNVGRHRGLNQDDAVELVLLLHARHGREGKPSLTYEDRLREAFADAVRAEEVCGISECEEFATDLRKRARKLAGEQWGELLHARALEKGCTPESLWSIWVNEAPHFGGEWPHRYDGSPFCVYCGRPKDLDCG